MNETLVLGGTVLASWFLVVYLRVPPAALFLSILAGKLFSEELAFDLTNFLNRFFSNIDQTYLHLGLLLAPVILTILFTRKSEPKSKTFINGVPLFLCLVTLALFINPYFNVVDKLDENQKIILTSNQSYIVSATALLTLVVTWTPHMNTKNSKKHHK